MSRFLVLAALGLALAGASAAVADEVFRDRIAAPAAGSAATVKGELKGYDSYEYLIEGKAGQSLTVKLEASNRSTYFNIWAPGRKPGADEALFAGAETGDVFSQKLEQSGDYMAQVYLYRNAARRDEATTFSLTVEIADGQAGTPGEDFADGLSGGPDFWEVTGLAAGGTLNLRAEAAASAAIVGRLRQGTVLRNKGCRMASAQRWCNVEQRDDAKMAGWVAGRFLREAAVAESGAASGDALVSGTSYHAVGRLPCALDGQPDVEDCEFGVTRGAPGVATVFITVPNGFVRVLAFDNGKVAPQSEVTDFSFIREQDNTMVKVNGLDERYTIPDAVIFGG